MIDTTAASPIGERLPSVAYAPGWAPAAVTPRGHAACRLSEFADAWAELGAEDRRWFAEWLTEPLVDACSELTA